MLKDRFILSFLGTRLFSSLSSCVETVTYSQAWDFDRLTFKAGLRNHLDGCFSLLSQHQSHLEGLLEMQVPGPTLSL